MSTFESGYVVGIYVKKDFKEKNEFRLNTYDYGFIEALINEVGKMVWPIKERQNIVMSKRLFKLPELHHNAYRRPLNCQGQGQSMEGGPS